MKCKLIFPIVILLFVFITSCQKRINDISANQKSILNSENNNVRKAVAAQFNNEVYNQMLADNEARMALLNSDASRGGCVQTVIVPDDYLTIREAMDAVCKNGTIIVKDGTYNEHVLVDKPGLSIKAVGDVTVKGVFYLFPNADRVEIQNFKIIPVGPNGNAANGIYGHGIQGGEIKQNVIIGVGEGYAIVLGNSNNISIIQNQVSDFKWGIVFISNDGVRSSNKNIIQDNTISGISYASCIGLEGDCNHNLIIGNVVQNNPNIANAGIYLGRNGAFQPNHNIVKSNTVINNEYTGIWINGGSQNTIGPNNICNDTYGDEGIGMYFSADNIKTQVFNNTVLENTLCDIVFEEGADIIFENNTYSCFWNGN